MPAADADVLRDELLAATSWVQGQVFRYEKYIPEPRLGAMQRRRQVGTRRWSRPRDWIQRRYRVMFDGLALPGTATSATASAGTVTAN